MNSEGVIEDESNTPEPVNSEGVIEDESNTPEPADSEEAVEDESNPSTDQQSLPASDPNPLNSPGNSLDTLLQRGMNDDLWQEMKGNLHCVDATIECIVQLQEIAAQQNPLLVEIDARIEEISTKIEEAKAQNKKSIDLSVLRPAAKVFLEPTFTDALSSQPNRRQRGPIEKLVSIFSSPVGVINEVLRAVGIPLFDKLFGGNDQNQERAIAISDLSVKLAEIQRGRTELAEKVKEKVALSVFDFDTSRRDFQISLEISKREASRMQLSEVKYTLGQGDSITYLGQLSSLDRNKAQTWKSWASMRSQLEKIKLLVLGTPE